MIDRTAPAVRPEGRPAGFQRWRKLLFLHWELDAAALAATLPDGLALDTFEGRAYIGVVPFTMRDVAPWWSPSVPGVSNFHELNVRTYVVHDGVPGVWFYSLDAASSLAVVVARAGWKLPYHKATMRMDVDGEHVSYHSERRWPAPTPATFAARYTIGAGGAGEQGEHCAAAGTLEHYLVERYVLYTVDGSGRLLSGQVHHEPYPLSPVSLEHVESSMVEALGLGPIRGAPLVHYSEGVDVDVFDLAPV